MTKKKTNSSTHKHKVTRREFTKKTAQVTAAISLFNAGLASGLSNSRIEFVNEEFEYIIVGSGAGGGPLAANLARAGHRVLLLEAGDNDPSDDVYSIPAFHPNSSEDPRTSWAFYVKHYSDLERQQADSKYVPGKGIYYPRASTIGGCTTHHAMITVYPHNSDFNRIADITGDDSWDAYKMRRYFERLEHCQYLPRPWFGYNPSRHGFDGWLRTNTTDIRSLMEDPILNSMTQAGLAEAGLENFLDEILAGNPLDINHWRVAFGEEGAYFPAKSTNRRHQRHGVREYLLSTQAQYPDKLVIRTGALVTRVLLDDDNTAIGVEYLEGSRLYRADPLHEASSKGTKRDVRATREVILAGGTFNSPQLLQLSGIGPAEELQRHNIEVKVDRQGVGKNLQDRYEVGVVNRLTETLPSLKNCTFGWGDDPCMKRYKERWWNPGAYASNGTTLSLVKRSKPEMEDPDLFIFGVTGRFNGYFPGYSMGHPDILKEYTWLVLKGHTNNNAGYVGLNSNDPQDVPNINFKYFDEGNDASGDDLQAVVEGVKTCRSIMNRAPAQDWVVEEVFPGAEHQSDEEIKEYAQKEAWGHHASCTNKMGIAGDPKAVVDSNFKVHGTKNLRVVDASVFPYIPGFFIVTSVYMISEKATDVILAEARQQA
ncbi:GMC family oxidoreductase [Pleionea sp. CnH1-48]|uniref:GMC family oxidoreductase n=1 Tax=Pleionea sp. CnH1-48 TaxID=2954494 RepID=UPI002097DB71|nr:GMC family oxidoreductase [Pleionea sp. CnH1-48]MCO7223660.1 GMC family oxidoreductase [Pleionea sp. CnH1-48]